MYQVWVMRSSQVFTSYGVGWLFTNSASLALFVCIGLCYYTFVFIWRIQMSCILFFSFIVHCVGEVDRAGHPAVAGKQSGSSSREKVMGTKTHMLSLVVILLFRGYFYVI